MGLKSIIPPHKPVKEIFDKISWEKETTPGKAIEVTKKEFKKIVQTTQEPPVNIFQELSFNNIAKERILKENPRIGKCPSLLTLFIEILFYRWSSKKKKTGYINATINQISIGIQLTEEETNAIMLDNSPV